MNDRFEIRSVWSTTEDFQTEVLFFVYFRPSIPGHRALIIDLKRDLGGIPLLFVMRDDLKRDMAQIPLLFVSMLEFRWAPGQRNLFFARLCEKPNSFGHRNAHAQNTKQHRCRWSFFVPLATGITHSELLALQVLFSK